MATVYTLDLTPNWSYIETVTVSQDDVGREIEIDLTLDGAAYAIPSGATVTMHGTKPSGLGYTITGTFTANDDAVTFETTSDMTDEAGRFASEVVVTNGTTVIGSANFDLYVEKSPHPSSTTDGTIGTMQTLEARITALENGASTVPTSVRSAIYTLLNSAAYTTTGLDDEIAVVEAWATAVTAITISQTSISISGSGTYQLTATTTPSGGAVTWESSDDTIATVDSTGLVTSVANGTATITASSGDYSATCEVTVSGLETLTGITATYTQSGTVYDTADLSDLTADLVVTATYDDSTTATLTSDDYTLSGTLAEGTSTITVTYGEFTDTFTVTVTEYVVPPLYNWDLTSSLTDSVGNVLAVTTATLTPGTGLVFDATEQYCDFGETFSRDRTYELDVVSLGTALGSTSSRPYRRLLMFDTDDNTSSGGAGLINSNKSGRYGWMFYLGSAWDSTFLIEGTSSDNEYNYFNGQTVKTYIDADGNATVYMKTIGADDSTYTLVGSSTGALSDYTSGHVYLGSSDSDTLASATISGLRIYEGEV